MTRVRNVLVIATNGSPDRKGVRKLHAPTYSVHGHTLAALIDRRGFSGAALARAARVDRSLISRLCSGERKTVTFQTARAISKALDIDLEIWADPISDIGPRPRLEQKKCS